MPGVLNSWPVGHLRPKQFHNLACMWLLARVFVALGSYVDLHPSPKPSPCPAFSCSAFSSLIAPLPLCGLRDYRGKGSLGQQDSTPPTHYSGGSPGAAEHHSSLFHSDTISQTSPVALLHPWANFIMGDHSVHGTVGVAAVETHKMQDLGWLWVGWLCKHHPD